MPIMKDLSAYEPSAAEQSGSSSAQAVVCVNLDGALVKSGLIWEYLITLVRVRPRVVPLLGWWLLQGKSALKRKLAKSVELDVRTLHFRADLLAFLAEEHGRGRRIVLVTDWDESLGQSIADHLRIFDSVYSPKDGANSGGAEKAAALRTTFADAGYFYIGNSDADLPVWKASQAGCVVGGRALVQKARSVTKIDKVFDNHSPSLLSWWRALRGHHWTKNLLVLLPMFLAHRLELRTFSRSVLGALLFSFCASSTYILNDLLDLHSDRAHPWKAKRPFSSGENSIPAGLFISLVLVTGSIALGEWLNSQFAVVLVIYVITTLWYSIQGKRIPLLDIFVLAGFYLLRLWAGACLASVPLSDWFLAFSLFFFLSLAMAKRYSELIHAAGLVNSGKSGRGYFSTDRDVLMHLGVASSFAGVVILALYVHSNEVRFLYRRPQYLLLICPLILYWLSRMWLKASRGELDEDPVTLSMRDPVGYGIAVVILAVLLFSAFSA